MGHQQCRISLIITPVPAPCYPIPTSLPPHYHRVTPQQIIFSLFTFSLRQGLSFFITFSIFQFAPTRHSLFTISLFSRFHYFAFRVSSLLRTRFSGARSGSSRSNRVQSCKLLEVVLMLMSWPHSRLGEIGSAGQLRDCLGSRGPDRATRAAGQSEPVKQYISHDFAPLFARTVFLTVSPIGSC